MSKPPPPDETAGPLLTIAEVADRLRVDQKTVRRWISTKALGAFKLGEAVANFGAGPETLPPDALAGIGLMSNEVRLIPQ